VLRLITTLARAAFGFALASIAAGLVTVMFVDTPVDVLAQSASRLPQTASETLDLALLTATHSAIFAAAFMLIAAGLGEWLSIRSLAFYLTTGMGIALLGFIAQFSSEVAGQPTILNNYALKAFLTAGFFGGFVYWLASGQFAGRAPEVTNTATSAEPPALPVAPPYADNQGRVVINNPQSEKQSRTRCGSLLNRFRHSRRNEAEPVGADKTVESSDDTEPVIIRNPASSPARSKVLGTDDPSTDEP
jgi:hypothetical protein